METSPDQTEGLTASVKRLLKTVVDIARNRLELFLVEAQEERAKLVALLLLGVSVAVLGLVTLLLVEFTVVILCFLQNRPDLLLALILIHLLATVGLFWRLRVQLNHWKPFSATRAEFRKDKACLDEKS